MILEFVVNGSECIIIPSELEDKDDEHKVKKGESNKNESEDLSTSESSDESSMAISSGMGTWESDSGVGVDSNSHSDVSSNDGGEGSEEVWGSGVWEIGWGGIVAHLKGVDGESEDEGEKCGPDGKVKVFFV